MYFCIVVYEKKVERTKNGQSLLFTWTDFVFYGVVQVVMKVSDLITNTKLRMYWIITVSSEYNLNSNYLHLLLRHRLHFCYKVLKLCAALFFLNFTAINYSKYFIENYHVIDRYDSICRLLKVEVCVLSSTIQIFENR